MRLIDADALMTEFMDSDLDHLQRDDWRDVIQIVTDAPTVNPEPHWIPVTERPDKSGDYLATLIDGAEKWVEIIYWNETFGGSWQAVIGDEEYYSTIGNVIAWMPLPEPFKGVTT